LFDVVQAVPEQVVPMLTSEPVCAVELGTPSTSVVWVAVQVPEVLQSACMFSDWFWS